MKAALQDYGKLVGAPELADVVLLVGGERFPAHRIVLTARSAFFRGLLLSGMQEGGGQREVSIGEVSARAFRVVLRHLYTAELPAWGEQQDAGKAAEDDGGAGGSGRRGGKGGKAKGGKPKGGQPKGGGRGGRGRGLGRAAAVSFAAPRGHCSRAQPCSGAAICSRQPALACLSLVLCRTVGRLPVRPLLEAAAGDSLSDAGSAAGCARASRWRHPGGLRPAFLAGGSRNEGHLGYRIAVGSSRPRPPT